MILRKLEVKDAEGMLEWMSDPNIKGLFRFSDDALKKENILKFIEMSQCGLLNKHYAIINEEDEYLGTISLKNIDMLNCKAEYAIATRSYIHGNGIAIKATEEILKIGFKELKLNKIYLNVLEINTRAIRFYEKIGFVKEGIFRKEMNVKSLGYVDLIWYSILNTEYEKLERSE